MTQSVPGAYRVGGRFPLGEVVERRGIGDIYQGSDDQTGSPVHVLLVSPHIFPQPWMRDRALAEMQGIGQSTHWGIVGIVGVGLIEDGRLYAASETPPPYTLSTYVAGVGPLPLEQSVSLFGRLGMALGEAKRLGIWHRDLSPSNMYLSPDLAVVKLHHFGLSELCGGAAFGDPWFTAPERILGNEPDERSTVYSLAALWYYAMCGQPVFLGEDANAALRMHQSEPPQPPSARRPDLAIPQGFDALMLRSLEKNPGARFGSLEEMLAAANALLQSVTPSSPDLGAAATMMATPGDYPRPAAPQPVDHPAPQPVAQAAPQPADHPAPQPVAQAMPQAAVAASGAPAPIQGQGQAQGQAQAQAQAPLPGRRRKKKGFRETLWFMKGEVDPGTDEQIDEKELSEVQVGDGSISDKDQSMDDRYRDDGSVTAEDRRKFSIKTGQTGMLPAVQVPQPMDPTSVPDLEKRRGVVAWVLIIIVVLGGGAVAAAFFFLRPSETFVSGNLALTIAAQVSEYKVEGPKKFLVPPTLRALPKAEDKELFAKLLELGSKEEAYLEAVDTLAALEKRIAAIEAENQGLPKRKQTTLWRSLDRRKEKALQKEYSELKAKIIHGLKSRLASALKGGEDRQVIDAKAACVQMLDNVALADDKTDLEKSCKALDRFFGLEDEAASGDAGSAPRARPASEDRPAPK